MEANMVLLWHHYEEPFSEDELISFAPAFYGSLSAPSPADDLVAWGGQLPVVSLHVISIPVSFHPLGASIILRGAWDWLWGGCCRRKNHCSLFSLVCKQIFDETHQHSYGPVTPPGSDLRALVLRLFTVYFSRWRQSSLSWWILFQLNVLNSR